MYRDPAFQEPFSTWEPKQLLALGRLCGRRSLQAKWAFLALVPEISLKEAYRREGCTSVFEYAARKGGMDRREVQDVLNLYGKIGRYWVLWRLLAMGAVGMSKLQRIARWVTPENAAWWAEQVAKCTRAQLDALIEAMHAREAQGAKAARDGNASDRKAQAPGHLAAEPRESELEPASTKGMAPGPGSPETGATRLAAGDDTRSGEPVFIRLQMSPYAAKALRDLHAMVERAEGPTSLSELVARLAIEALGRGSVPVRQPRQSGHAADERAESPDESRSGAEAPEQSTAESRPTTGAPERARVALPPRRMLQVVYRNLDTGAQWLPSSGGPIAVENIPRSGQERVAAAPSVLFAELRARALAAKVRHAGKVAALRKAGELLDADDGRHIPAAVEIYLMARSGGLCERDGCRGQAEHFHHCDPYAEHQTHDPDRMLAICKTCHDGYHGGLVVPDKVDPRIWWPVKTSSPVARSEVDEACLEAKARYRDVG